LSHQTAICFLYSGFIQRDSSARNHEENRSRKREPFMLFYDLN